MSNGKTRVWYHGGCWDGFGAAWACRRWLRGPIEFVPCQYGMATPEYNEGDVMFIVDFSFCESIMGEIASRLGGGRLTVIDHHASAEAAVRSVGGIFDATRSGAVLTWLTLAPEGSAVPDLLLYVQDRDLWRFELPHSRTIQWLIRSLPHEFQAWDLMAASLDRDEPTGFQSCLERAAAVENFVRLQIAEQASHAYKTTLGGHEIMAVNATLLTSDTCDLLIQRGAKVAGCFVVGGDGKTRWGLRSKNGEAMEIAKSYGGGGHPNAAGFIA